MASIIASNQVFATSGVPFTGVIRIFPNGSSPMFGAVLHYEFDDGYLISYTGSNNFSDDEYCVQWLHFATIGSSANAIPQACEYVVMIQGDTEITDLQATMMSYDSYTSALAICRADIMALDNYAQSLESQNQTLQTQLQTCQDQAAEALAQAQADYEAQLEECEDQLTATQLDGQELTQQLADTETALAMCQASLQQCLDDLEAMTTQAEIDAQLQAIQDQMNDLRNNANGIVTVRVPKCNAPGNTPEDVRNTQELMQRMAGYNITSAESKRAGGASAASIQAAQTAAKLIAQREKLVSKMSELAKYVPKQFCDDKKRVPVKVVNPPRHIPENAPSLSDVADVRTRIEELKQNCGN